MERGGRRDRGIESEREREEKREIYEIDIEGEVERERGIY